MHKKKKLVRCLALVFVFLPGFGGAVAANIAWNPTSAWTLDATSDSIPYKSGLINVTVTGSSVGTLGQVVNFFATTSADYQNIDVATHHVLRISPANPATAWSIEFDLVGTTVSAEDVFTAGQLAISASNVHLTDLTIQMFAPDDVSPIDLATLDFEQHALISANFDAMLDWNPATGLLQPVGEGASKNSGWGFFSPTTVEIGKIVVTAATIGGPDAINFSFGQPVVVPVPGAAWLLSTAVAGLLGWSGRKRKHGWN
jgi:hypothetical protein